MKRKYIVVISIAILLFIIFIWPTAYSYDTFKGEKYTRKIRTNRITRDISIKNSFGEWEKQPRKDKAILLSDYDMRLITGKAVLSSNYLQELNLDLYNGSNYAIYRIVVTLTIFNQDGTERWTRQYETETDISPLSTSKCSIYVNDIDNLSSFNWSITEMYGVLMKKDKR